MHNLDQVLSKLHHPDHIRLYQYWSSKSQPGRLPGRQNLDPVEIPDLLFNLALRLSPLGMASLDHETAGHTYLGDLEDVFLD